MKQVWAVSVFIAFAILEGRVEFANYLAVVAGRPDMTGIWHAAWLAGNASAALIAGTVIAFIVDLAGERVDALGAQLAPQKADIRK